MAAKTWILTGSLDNFRATRDHDFSEPDSELLESRIRAAAGAPSAA